MNILSPSLLSIDFNNIEKILLTSPNKKGEYQIEKGENIKYTAKALLYPLISSDSNGTGLRRKQNRNIHKSKRNPFISNPFARSKRVTKTVNITNTVNNLISHSFMVSDIF